MTNETTSIQEIHEEKPSSNIVVLLPSKSSTENQSSTLINEEKSPSKLSASFYIDYNTLKISSFNLGIGTFAKIYMASWQGQKVAVKRFNNFSESLVKNYFCTDEDLAAFKNEATFCEILRKNPLSFVPQYYGYVEDLNHQPKPFYGIVMELLEGNVSNFIASSGGLPPEIYFKILIATASALIEMQSADFIHCDLTWDNTFYLNDKIKFIDYSTALFLQGEPYKIAKLDSCPEHQAPEVSKEYKRSRASEVYAFGGLIFEIIQNKYPTPLIVRNIIDMTPADEARMNKNNFPTGIAKLIRQCWLDEPSERPSMRKVYDELIEINKKYSK